MALTCNEVDERDVIEDYLLGRLTEPDREAFEDHYFACEHCAAELDAVRAVQSALAARPAAPARTPRPASHWARLALAATVVLSSLSVVWWWQRTRNVAPGAGPPAGVTATAPAGAPVPASPGGATEIARLARVEPPAFSTTNLRRGAVREAFAAGMQRYAAKEYEKAIPLLSRAVTQEPAADDARFYMGASQLLTGHAAEAIATLAPVRRRAQSPYAEEARFLSAKAYLQLGDVPRAVAELEATEALRGDRAKDARAMREQVAAAGRR